jgi:hypothetical protein
MLQAHLLSNFTLEQPKGVFLFLLALQAKHSAYIGSVEEKIGSLLGWQASQT